MAFRWVLGAFSRWCLGDLGNCAYCKSALPLPFRGMRRPGPTKASEMSLGTVAYIYIKNEVALQNQTESSEDNHVVYLHP